MWLQKGLETTEHLSNSKKDLYTNHFSVYKAILLENQVLIPIFKKSFGLFRRKAGL